MSEFELPEDAVTWLVSAEGDRFDIEAIAEQFASGDPQVSWEDEAAWLSSSQFRKCSSAGEVHQLAKVLERSINLMMRALNRDYDEVRLGSKVICEKDGSRTATHIVAVETARLRVKASAVLVAITQNGDAEPIQRAVEPSPSLLERILPVIERDPGIRDAAAAVGSRAPKFTDLFIAYETIRDSVTGDPTNWKMLANLGWATEGQLDLFYRTGQHFRHGHPRKSLDPQMPLEDATELMRRLFQR